jgi:hypothetical protein
MYCGMREILRRKAATLDGLEWGAPIRNILVRETEGVLGGAALSLGAAT